MKNYIVTITDNYGCVNKSVVRTKSESEAFNKAEFDNRTVERVEIREVI